MASELSMNGKKKIETLQKEFTQKFAYLTLVFLDKERRAIDISKSLSEVRQAKGDDISIIASLKVNTLEKRFLENFGIIVEVAYQKFEKVVYTKDNIDKTLNELNKWCEENDCQPFEFKKSFTGNTLSSVQEQLFEAIKAYYPNAEAKKINKDNYVDIYVPEINKKRGTHLFFNTAKDGIKIGFYCRDEEFVENVLSKSSNIEKYAQGIRILDNPLQNDVKEATKSALSFIEEITGEQKERIEEDIELDLDKILKDLGYGEEVDIEEETTSEENEEENEVAEDLEKLLKDVGYYNNIGSLLVELEYANSSDYISIKFYTKSRSELNYWLKYQIENSVIEITRTNWSEDSYWEGKIKREDLFEGLTNYNDNSDISELINNYLSTDLIEYNFSTIGENDNGLEYEITSVNPELNSIPDEFQDFAGDLDITSLANNLQPISEKLADKHIGYPSYYEINISDKSFRIEVESIEVSDDMKDSDQNKNSSNEIDEQNFQLIESLERFDDETTVMVQMFSQFGITEVGNGSGSWEGNDYTYDYRTEWNEGYLEDFEAISVESLIELLKSKNINDFSQDDFGSLGAGTLRDGNTTYENFKWASGVNKKDIKNAPDEEELCAEGEKQDSEYLWQSPERIEFIVTEEEKEDLNFILKNKNAVSADSDSEIDPTHSILKIDQFLEILKECDEKEESIFIYYYTSSRSSFSQLLTFQIDGKEIVLRRNHWYEDSYWSDDPTITHLISRIEEYIESEDDPGFYIFQDKREFYMQGDGNNGFDLELVETDFEESNYPKNILDKDGDLDVYKLYENYDYETENEDQDEAGADKIFLEYNGNKCEIDTNEPIDLADNDDSNTDEDESSSKASLFFSKNANKTIVYDEVFEMSEGMIRVKKDDSFGFLDKEGNEIVPCNYLFASDFKDDICYLVSNNEEGETVFDYINRKNEKYFSVKNYSNGNAPNKYGAWLQKEDDSNWEFYDLKGNLIHTVDYEYVTNFKEGYSWCIKDKTIFLLSISGKSKKIITSNDEICTDLFNGLFAISVDEKYGFYKQDGTSVSKFIYDSYKLNLSNGFISVCIHEKWGVMNSEGKVVIPCIYDDMEDGNDNLFIVTLDDKKGIVDVTGNKILEIKYDDINGFENSFAIVELNGMYGVIDKKGLEVVSCISLDWPSLHSNQNFVVIDTENGASLIDLKTGESLLKSSYSTILVDGNNLLVKNNDKWGWVDNKENVLIKFKYDDAWPFKNSDLAKVQENEKFGFIDKSENFKIKPIYTELEPFEGNYAIASLDGQSYGIIDKNGNEIVEFNYSTIEYDTDGFFKLTPLDL